MRKQFWIPCAVVLTACLLLLWLLPKPRHAVALEEQSQNSSDKPSEVKSEDVSQSHRLSTNSPPTRTVLPSARNLVQSNSSNPLILSKWQTPIDFYGKVIDEKSNAVPGVNVHFRWYETPNADGEKTLDAVSDSGGLFSLNGQHGPSLTISFSKEGYYSSHNGQLSFNFGAGPDILSPDSANPILFNVRKKGVRVSLISLKRNYKIPKNGTAIGIDLVSGQTVAGNTGNFVVSCLAENEGKKSGQKYNWHCRVAIPGGGLVLTEAEFNLQAPEVGYVNSTEINMPMESPDWKDDVDLKIYYRLADGRYGKMTFSMIAGGQHFCMIDSLLNPSGSPNLESDGASQ